MSSSAQESGGQEPADSVYALPPIEITSSRFQNSHREAAHKLSTIEQEAIQASGSRHVGELLDRVSPLSMRRYGSGLATASMRGASASQTLILLDGLPLSDPQLGQVDYSLLPIGLTDRVVMLHGAGSSLYGSSGMGGVIDIQTFGNRETPGIQSSITAGPYGERQGNLSLAGTRKNVSARVHFAHEFAENDFSYLNSSLFPPQRARRENADRTQTSVLGSLRFKGVSSQTTVSFIANRAERGLPGLATTSTQGERQWDEVTRGWVGHTRGINQGVVSLRSAFQQGVLRYQHPELEIDQAGHTTSAMLGGEWTLPLKRHIKLTSGIETAYRRARHPSLSVKASEYQISGFVFSRLTQNRLTITPSGRIDSFFGGEKKRTLAFSPQVGVNLQPFSHDFLRLKTSIGRAFRTPTFNDRFWQPGGNPFLKAESGWTYDAGVFIATQRPLLNVTGEFTLFQHRFRNQIVWTPGPSGFWTPQNVTRTRSQGFEASGSVGASLSQWTLTGQVHYTHTAATDRSDPASPSFGNPLRYVPAHQAKASMSLRRPIGRLETLLDLFVRHSSLRYITTDATQYMPAYSIFDANVRVRWRSPSTLLSLGVFLENVLNEDYEVIKGYPMLPRLIRFQLSVQIY